MSVSRSFTLLRGLNHNLRKYSSSASAPLVNLAFNEKSGVATLTLQRPPVNSLNLELLSAISNSLTDLEKNKCRGLILTSSSNSVFSAGLDITEMHEPDLERLKQFWTTLQQTWIKLYGSSFPTVAAINGHSPAGGCLLAMSCEYRIMLNNFTIGLNETQLGIVAPTWFAATMRNTIGLRQTELALTTGRLFKTEEALSIGLIDEIAASKDEALEKSEKFLQKFARIPPSARAYTKKMLRQADIEALTSNMEGDLKVVTTLIASERIQKGLGLYIQSLKAKQK